MAKFAPDFKLHDLLEQQLKCPRCQIFMKPEIFQCSSGHPICMTCWKKEEKCLNCDEIYKKDLTTDMYDGYKLYDYRCQSDKKCDKVVMFQGQLSSVHSVMGNGLPYKFTCKTCQMQSGKLYPLKSVLVTAEKYKSEKLAFKPIRNFHLEMYTAFVLYPCKNEGCSALIPLAETEIHEADCVYRNVNCPHKYDGCKFEGSVSSLIDHVSDGTKHNDPAFFDSKSGKPLSLEFIFPLETEDYENLWMGKPFIYNGTVPSVILATLHWPGDEPFQLCVEHVGIKSVSDTLSYNVRLDSKSSGNYMILHNTVQNDIEANETTNWLHLWQFSYLKEKGFFECDGENLKLVLQVKIEENRRTNLVPQGESKAESVD